jgi:hypothetical protein
MRPMAGASPFRWHWPGMASSTWPGGRPMRFSSPRITALANADASRSLWGAALAIGRCPNRLADHGIRGAAHEVICFLPSAVQR